MKISKRKQAILDLCDKNNFYDFNIAYDILKNKKLQAKFDQSLDISVALGIDPRKSDQLVKGNTILPHGHGKKITVAVFAEYEDCQKAKKVGADYAGLEELAEEIKLGKVNPSVVLATPEVMSFVGRLGPILGSKGLMPSAKTNTLVKDVAEGVKLVKSGQIKFSNDKKGIIHCSIGKISFSKEQALENLKAILKDIRNLKPSTSKGVYFKNVVLSTTFGPGIKIKFNELIN